MNSAALGECAAQLEARLREYHSVGLADVLDIVSYLRKEDDTVIAGGSLAVGLGNRLSDMDVVIVGEQTIESSRVPLEHFVGSLRVDAWVMSKALIDEVFELAEGGLAQGGRLDILFANVDDEVNLKLLHRIAFGLTLDGPSVEPSGGRDHASIAREVVVREYVERMREHAFLAQAAAAAERSFNAAINARDAIEEALHALITAQGIPFTGHKWLQERLRDDAAELAPVYRPFATLPDQGEDWKSFVSAAIEQCEARTGVPLDPPTLARQCGWRNRDLRLAEVADAHLLLSVDAGALWELDEGEAATWAELTDGQEDQSSAEWRCAELAPDQAALCFALYERGLVELHFSEGVPIAGLAFEIAGQGSQG
jgi:Nucleotidyltransferase domain